MSRGASKLRREGRRSTGHDEAALDALTDDELLLLHREVCRRAAKVYETRYRSIRDANFATAMANRDTRFVKGLSVRENIERNMVRA